MVKADKEKLEIARRTVAEQVDQLVSATGYLLEPLKSLSEAQLGAVVALGLLMQAVMLAKRPTGALNEDVLARFKEEVDSICPPLGKVALSRDPCLEATIAYVSALKKCQDEGVREEDCPDAWGPGAAAVRCVMREIENRRREIEGVLGRLDPPRPIPWPVS